MFFFCGVSKVKAKEPQLESDLLPVSEKRKVRLPQKKRGGEKKKKEGEDGFEY